VGDAALPGHLVLAGITFALATFALGRYSRLLEHDADLCVFEVGRAETFIAAIDRLSFLCDDRRQRATWLHPSTAARVQLLQRALGDPQTARAFRARVERVNRLLISAWLAAPLAAIIG